MPRLIQLGSENSGPSRMGCAKPRASGIVGHDVRYGYLASLLPTYISPPITRCGSSRSCVKVSNYLLGATGGGLKINNNTRQQQEVVNGGWKTLYALHRIKQKKSPAAIVDTFLVWQIN